MEERPAGSAASGSPRRVRVTAPSGAMPRFPRRADSAGADDFYVRALIRAQLRLSLSVAVGFLLLLLCLALLVALWPQIHEVRWATIPLPWLLLGVGVYPIILLGASLFNRAAARNEARYRNVSRR